jgi:hypothetical protein
MQYDRVSHVINSENMEQKSLAWGMKGWRDGGETVEMSKRLFSSVAEEAIFAMPTENWVFLLSTQPNYRLELLLGR